MSSIALGGSFLDGFEEGAFSGAITGAIMGGLAAGGSLLGSTLGKSCEFVSKFGSAIKWTSRISAGTSAVMDGFDALAFGIGLIDSDNPIVQLNQKLHSSKLYNAFQIGVNAVAVFSGGMSHGMSQVTPSCFIAGTMVLTTAGLVAIENIKAGDIIISTNPDTLETAEKSVIETYIRQVDTLVHLTINGEEIVTTVDHPFYVQSRGFINAGNLLVGGYPCKC